MEHPFEVGETYENAIGEYTVLSISLSTMQVQYTHGSEATVSIDTQARIWDRMHRELAVAKEEPQRSVRARPSTNAFLGLEESDFKDNVAGTTWRSCERLGGLISQQLFDTGGNAFISRAIPRLPQLYVYTRGLPMDKRKVALRLPKFVVRLDSETLYYGFYIEKSDEPMAGDWYWPRFMNLLSDAAWQEKIEKAMTEQELDWVEYGDASGEPKVLGRDVRPLLVYLQSLPPQQWCNLFIEKTMAKSEALKMKENVSRPIVHTFNALVPMFLGLLEPPVSVA